MPRHRQKAFNIIGNFEQMTEDLPSSSAFIGPSRIPYSLPQLRKFDSESGGLTAEGDSDLQKQGSDPFQSPELLESTHIQSCHGGRPLYTKEEEESCTSEPALQLAAYHKETSTHSLQTNEKLQIQTDILQRPSMIWHSSSLPREFSESSFLQAPSSSRLFATLDELTDDNIGVGGMEVYVRSTLFPGNILTQLADDVSKAVNQSSSSSVLFTW